MKDFSQFLKSVNGDLSSKRLAGLTGWITFLLLSASGAITFLCKNQPADFNSVVETVAWASAAVLGVSVVEHLKTQSKKK
jgi:peroxiredoxin